MSIAYDAHSDESSVQNSTFSWTHTPVGTPAGVVVLISQDGDADQVSGVTYGGVAMTRHLTEDKSSNEEARVYVYVLLASVPTGAQTVQVTLTGSDDTTASAHTVTTGGGRDPEIVDEFADNGVGNSGEPEFTLSLAGGRDHVIFGVRSCGVGSTANLRTIEEGGDGSRWTQQYAVDFGATTGDTQYRTDVWTDGEYTANWATTGTDDYCVIVVALAESIDTSNNGGMLISYGRRETSAIRQILVNHSANLARGLLHWYPISSVASWRQIRVPDLGLVGTRQDVRFKEWTGSVLRDTQTIAYDVVPGAAGTTRAGYETNNSGGTGVRSMRGEGLEAEVSTIGMWVRMQSAGNFPMFFSCSGGSQFWELRAFGGSRRLDCFWNGLNPVSGVSDTITLDEWTHIAVVIQQGAGGFVRLFLNGEQVANSSGSPSAMTTIYPFYLGQRAGSGLGFPGHSDDVRLYNRPLSNVEVRQWYQETRAGSYGSLERVRRTWLVFAPLDSSSSSLSADSSSSQSAQSSQSSSSTSSQSSQSSSSTSSQSSQSSSSTSSQSSESSSSTSSQSSESSSSTSSQSSQSSSSTSSQSSQSSSSTSSQSSESSSSTSSQSSESSSSTSSQSSESSSSTSSQSSESSSSTSSQSSQSSSSTSSQSSQSSSSTSSQSSESSSSTSSQSSESSSSTSSQSSESSSSTSSQSSSSSQSGSSSSSTSSQSSSSQSSSSQSSQSSQSSSSTSSQSSSSQSSQSSQSSSSTSSQSSQSSSSQSSQSSESSSSTSSQSSESSSSTSSQSSQSSSSQSSSQSECVPGTEIRHPASQSSDPVEWVNAANALGFDLSTSARALTIGPGSGYLQLTDFGFTLPPDGIIDGVQVTVWRRANDSENSIRFEQVQIRANNGTLSDPRDGALGGWSTDVTAEVLGGASDTWGLASQYLTTEAFSSEFSFFLNAECEGVEVLFVHAVRVQVWWSCETSSSSSSQSSTSSQSSESSESSQSSSSQSSTSSQSSSSQSSSSQSSSSSGVFVDPAGGAVATESLGGAITSGSYGGTCSGSGLSGRID